MGLGDTLLQRGYNFSPASRLTRKMRCYSDEIEMKYARLKTVPKPCCSLFLVDLTILLSVPGSIIYMQCRGRLLHCLHLQLEWESCHAHIYRDHYRV
jgi:hypothetical protein